MMSSTERDTDQRSSYSSRVSSAPSVLSDNMEVEPEEAGGAPWCDDPDVDWQDKCLQLELSLHKFRDQAGKIRELLREKLAELEHRVIEAESRAEEAEDKVRMMEQKFAQAKWAGPGEQPRDKFSQLQVAVKHKDEIITQLETEVQEQKQLRMHDAKQVEAKAARIKEWVANKLKELEEQNQHLRQQNQKCNQQLELLKSRLDNLPCFDQMVKSCHRTSTEDSSRGSFEERPDSDENLPAVTTNATTTAAATTTITTTTSGLRRARSSSSGDDGAPGSRRGDSDTDPLYAEVDYSRKNSSGVPRTTPPRLKVERKKFHPAQQQRASTSSSPASEDAGGSDAECSFRADSEMETTPPPRSPLNSPADQHHHHPHPQHLHPLNNSSASSGHHQRATSSSSVNKKVVSDAAAAAVKQKPVPPPRYRLPPPKKLSEVEPAALADESWEDLCAQLEDALALESAEIAAGAGVAAGVDGVAGVVNTASPMMRRPGARVADEDESHDYAEIYTPSKERGPQWAEETTRDANKPPTPPLHRFPSWESRIYEIAANGISVEEGLTNGNHSDSTNNNTKPTTNCSFAHSSQLYPDINIPVYATVKGRASQIRSMPFTGESSDSSDNEDTRITMTTASSHTTSGETESSLSTSSPSKSLKGGSSPSVVKPNSASPCKSFCRDASVESTLSDDYTIPPDAMSSDALSIDSSLEPKMGKSSVPESPKKESLEKSGYLTKIGGKLKTWRKRWFVLKSGSLTYFKSQNDIHRKPQGQIVLDEVCHVTRAEGGATFEISTSKKMYYLTADSIATMEEWVRVLQNVLRRNATKLLLSKEENKPTITGWLVKVKHGHSKRCWCVLIGKMFLYFKSPNDTTPQGQLNMRDSRVEEVEHVSDSDEEDDSKGKGRTEFSVGIFPNHQGPTYLLMSSKVEKDTWLYHLTVVSGGSTNVGTQYEQLIQRLMEMSGDPNCVIWRHPVLLYNKDCITQPLSTLPSEQLQAEAVKLFKSCQLFMSVLVDSAGVDYHVVLAQNALQQCLTLPELQNEIFCQLIKQTSRHTQQKLGVQGWQLLALAVSIFLPKNSRLLWYLQLHLSRNANIKSEIGKYAIFCQRALERTKQNGIREAKPSRMEVLSILLKNPYHHSLPHSIPVHFLNGTYQVVGFDGSTTVEEFIRNLNQEIGVRDVSSSGFALYSDDPIDSTIERCLRQGANLSDIISKWETALRENKLGKFENTKVIKLTYKNRLYFRNLVKVETEKERLLLAFQMKEEILADRFPVTKDLSLELAALLAQVELGDHHVERGRNTPGSPGHHLHQLLEKYLPRRFREGHPDDVKQLTEILSEKWSALKGRPQVDCVRIYVNCMRKWPFFGSKLFPAKLRTSDASSVWLAVNDEGINLLDYATMNPLFKYPFECLETFGGCRDDFMLVVRMQTPEAAHNLAGVMQHHDKGAAADYRTEKHLFGMSKPQILEVTLLTADYMNALGKMPATPGSSGCLSRTDSRLRSLRGRAADPDVVKMAVEVESRLQRAAAAAAGGATTATTKDGVLLHRRRDLEHTSSFRT